MMSKVVLTLLVCIASLAPAQANELAQRQDEARTVAMSFRQRLAADLTRELETGSPDSAIRVCRSIAPGIANELSAKNGWRVSRVSLKVRNPLLATPDAWEQKVLAEFDRRAAAGEAADNMEYAEIVTEPQGKYVRYMKALGVQKLCLTCHGGPDNIPDSVKSRLEAQYPFDRATGYGLGQVRGAITIKRPL